MNAQQRAVKWTSTITPVTELKSGGKYLIYDASKITANGDTDRRAWRKVDDGSSNITGENNTSASAGQVLYDRYVFEATETETGIWQFKHLGTNKYIPSIFDEVSTCVSLSDTPGNWSLTLNSEHKAFKVKSEATNDSGAKSDQYWDGKTDKSMVTWNPTTDNASHWYQFYDIEADGVSIITTVDLTINFKEGDNVIKSVTVSGFPGAQYSEKAQLYTPAAVGIFGSENQTIDIQVSLNLPFPYSATEDWNSLKWVAIESHGNQAPYMWTHNDGSILSDDEVARPTQELYPDKQLFAFIGSYNTGFKIVNRAAGQGYYLTLEDGKGKMVENPENLLWKVYPTTVYDGDPNDTYACFKLVQGNSESGYLNHRGNPNHNFQTWTAADNGSSNRFFTSSDNLIAYYEANIADYEGATDVAQAYEAAKADRFDLALATEFSNYLKNAEGVALYNKLKNHGDIIAAIDGVASERIAAWQSVTANSGSKEEAEYKALKGAFVNLVNGLHMTFRHGTETGDYISQLNGNPRRWSGGEGSRVFTLEASEDSLGFKIKNEYLQKYIVHPTANNTNATFTDNVANATIYNIDYNTQYSRHGIFTPSVNADVAYWHSNGTNDLFRWEAGEKSSWVITIISDQQAASEDLGGAKDYYQGLLHDGLGEYSVSDENKATANTLIAAAEAENVEIATIRNVATTLRGFTANSLNMPQAGHFYRFKGATNEKYMTSIHTEDGNKLRMSTDANITETIFYYDADKRIVALKDGLVLGKFIQNNFSDNSSWTTVMPSNTEKVGAVEFAESGVQGKYNIIPSTSRYIYNLSDEVNCNSSDENGCRWEITQQTYLPIPGSEGNFASICAPVSLNLKAGVTANKVEIVDGKVSYTPITGDVIPANTAVVLHFTGGVDRDPSNKLVYLQINTTGGTAISEETGVMGSYLAVEKEANHKVFDGKNFSEPETDYTPGFHAYIDEAGETLAASYPVIDQLLTPGKIYYIAYANSGDNFNRGLLIHQEGEDAIWATGERKLGIDKEQAIQNALNPENADYHWMIVSDNDGKYYLYNLGAKKFAAAYGSNTNNQSEFSWFFADTPTAVEIKFHGWTPTANADEAIFNIHGGLNNLTGRPAGMMLITGNAAPVAGVSGTTDDKDGCGFVFGEVAYEEVPEVPTAADIEAVKEEMVALYNHAATIDWEGVSEENGNHIGYYAGEGLSQFFTTFNANRVDEDADAESKYYAVVRGHNAVADKTYHEFQNSHAYQLAVGNDRYINAADNEKGWELGEISASDDDRKYLSNWHAEVAEDGQITFSHVLSVPAPAEENVTEPETEPEVGPAAVRRRAEGEKYEQKTVAFTATPAYDGLGNVTLNLPTLGTVRVTSLGDDEDGKKTTAIEEVTVETRRVADGAIYDLQGRRVNKAAHGLYIINGKKVIK
ncbi:MAG: hypothetical protein NC301_08060 [Bacteroides sp.]|nr:hypothetical protein [Bacteroides sp.]MCM1379451.1 hypothetical protein [Bacteroides sp.]